MGFLFCLGVTAACIGLSIGPHTYPVPIRFLQIKNATRSPIFERMDWIVDGKGSLYAAANTDVSVGLLSSRDLAIRTGKIQALRFTSLVSSTVPLEIGKTVHLRLQTRNNKCITVMRCRRKPGGHCDPLSKEPIKSLQEVQMGTYLKLLRCAKHPHPSQDFVQISHNCTMSKLINGRCDDPDCNLSVFQNDSSSCNQMEYEYEYEYELINGTDQTPSITPSVTPSIEPTLMINETYYQPSSSPVETIPSRSPTPHVTESPSNDEVEVTSQPTLSQTNSSAQDDDDGNEPTGGPQLEYLALLLLLPVVAAMVYFGIVRMNKRAPGDGS